MRRLRLDELIGPGEVFHAARTRYGPEDECAFHCHDFAEVFWIDSGTASARGRDRAERLGPGSLRFVLPGDAHSFAASGGRPFSIVNVAYRVSAMRAMSAIHPEFFRRERSRRSFSVDASGIDELGSSFAALLRRERDLFSLERFLLEVMSVASSSGRRRLGAPSAPAWLRAAVERLLAEYPPPADPVSRLAALSGRSREHLSRVVKAETGKTASQWLRELRADEAAVRLLSEEGSVLDVALESGFSSLATFYRAFNARTGESPGEYRARARRAVDASDR